MTDRDRVLAALRRRGTYGITQLDFDGPTLDGGKPIRRVAARIEELRKQGHGIDSKDRRHKCAVYRLVWEPEGVGRAGEPGKATSVIAGGDTTGPPETTGLFTPPPAQPPRPGMYETWEDEAA